MRSHQQQQAAEAQLPPQIVTYLRGEAPGLTDAEAELFFAVGSSLYRDERYGEAADMFRALVLGRPTSTRAWACLAMCHDAVEDFDRAAALYELAVRAPLDDGYRIRARIYYARTLFWLERFDEAAAQLDAVAEIDVDDDLEATRAELFVELQRLSRRSR